MTSSKNGVPAIICGLILVAGSDAADSSSSGDLYGFDRVLTAHLTFTPENWEAIKPEEPAETRGGPGAFGPGGMLVGPFQKELDADKDGAFSKQEFVLGFQRWFAAWDVKKNGNLDSDAVRDGMNKDLNPFAGGLPGGGGPGGPGGSAATFPGNGISASARHLSSHARRSRAP